MLTGGLLYIYNIHIYIGLQSTYFEKSRKILLSAGLQDGLICCVKKTSMLQMTAKWTREEAHKQASIIDGTRPKLCSAGGPYDNHHRLWPQVSVQRAHVPLILTPLAPPRPL